MKLPDGVRVSKKMPQKKAPAEKKTGSNLPSARGGQLESARAAAHATSFDEAQSVEANDDLVMQ